MAPIGTLWGSPRQRQSKVILSVAAINGLDLQQAPFEFGVTNKSPEFLSKFPYGKIPVFEDSEGWNDIGGKSDFLGSNAKETALVDQWIHLPEHEIGAPVSGALGLVYGFSGPFTREALDKQ
ncbi:hypothetical protein BU15DRAFT_80184 [Melanogaster broomeanus]|nr:hypothetical protein BU15DRAFT_80184 [Melanogaster broomeanus]